MSIFPPDICFKTPHDPKMVASQTVGIHTPYKFPLISSRVALPEGCFIPCRSGYRSAGEEVPGLRSKPNSPACQGYLTRPVEPGKAGAGITPATGLSRIYTEMLHKRFQKPVLVFGIDRNEKIQYYPVRLAIAKRLFTPLFTRSRIEKIHTFFIFPATVRQFWHPDRGLPFFSGGKVRFR